MDRPVPGVCIMALSIIKENIDKLHKEIGTTRSFALKLFGGKQAANPVKVIDLTLLQSYSKRLSNLNSNEPAGNVTALLRSLREYTASIQESHNGKDTITELCKDITYAVDAEINLLKDSNANDTYVSLEDLEPLVGSVLAQVKSSSQNLKDSMPRPPSRSSLGSNFSSRLDSIDEGRNPTDPLPPTPGSSRSSTPAIDERDEEIYESIDNTSQIQAWRLRSPSLDTSASLESSELSSFGDEDDHMEIRDLPPSPSPSL